MNSELDKRVLAIHHSVIWTPVCRHLRGGEEGYVCLRCYGTRDPVFCDVCIAEHRANHTAVLCDLCAAPLGDLTADIAQTLTDVNNETTITTTLGRLVLGSVSVIGQVCQNCVAQHEMSHEHAN
jgi:hypothetical protein